MSLKTDCHCMHGIICHACTTAIEERTIAAVVAWMRQIQGLDDVADAIERGDWRPK